VVETILKYYEKNFRLDHTEQIDFGYCSFSNYPLSLLAYFATTQLNSALKSEAEKDLDHVVNTIHALCEISLSRKNGESFIPLLNFPKLGK